MLGQIIDSSDLDQVSGMGLAKNAFQIFVEGRMYKIKKRLHVEDKEKEAIQSVENFGHG